MLGGPLLADAELRSIVVRPNPCPVVDDPPRGPHGETVYDMFRDGEPVGQTLFVKDLIATQRAFDPVTVNEQMTEPDEREISVVRHNGKQYVVDGHHRAVAAAFRGDSTIRAQVVHASWEYQ